MIGCSDLMIKVCGLTRQEDADLCTALRVSLTGFIFHPKSPRNITPEQAADIDTGTAMRVGVFVDQGVEEIDRVMGQSMLHLAQLHGGQDVDFCRDLGRHKVMKVFWPESYADWDAFALDLERFAPHSRFWLFDAGKSGGGHGTTLQGSLLTGFKTDKSWFLAGGLGPDTIEQALVTCRPCGVDLNSGVESAPGIKDHDKLKKTVRIICARNA